MINGKKIIALCTARITDNLIHELVTQLNRRLVEEDYRLLVYHVCSDYYWEEDFMQMDASIFGMMDFDAIDAVVLMRDKIKSEMVADFILQGAQANNVPTITVDSKYDDCVSVRFDYEKGFEKVVRHVVEEHGVRDVHFMGGYPNNVFSLERLGVFQKVIAENGIEFKDSMVSYGEFWARPAQLATEKLICENRVPKAIICANDIMAINVCSTLVKYGYQVPGDVIVTGFDGIDEIYFAEPQITSCKCNFKRMANVIFDTVKKMLNQEEVSKDEPVWIDTDFLQMRSCGCIQAHKINDSDYMNRINNRFYRYQDDSKMLSFILEQMQECDTPEQVAKIMDSPVLDDLAIVLNEKCFDQTIHLTSESKYHEYDEKMYVIRDCARQDTVPRETNLKSVYGNIDATLEKKAPLVFNALGYMNNLLGYVCFFFEDDDISNYGRILQIVTSLNTGIGNFVNIRHQHYLREMIENMYKYDSLTGLYNRMGFNVEFSKLAKEAKAKNQSMTMIMLDLDGLKFINDEFGHLEGDIAIKAVANALKVACPEDALLLRLGGDEMLAVVVGECDVEQIRKKGADYLAEYNATSGKPYTVSASAGSYQTELDSEFDFDKLVEESDKIMYIEKQVHHREEMNKLKS